MNYPVWYIPEIGGGLLIAVIAVLHVFVSHFAVGGGLYLVLAEKMGLRERHQGILSFTRAHARFFLLLTMVFGSITGVGIWFIIALVNPAATSLLIHLFVFGWAAEWVFFVVEIVAAFVYFYCFEKMDSATHLTVGWIYFVSAWLSLFLINGIICFMLTPGEWQKTGGFWHGFFNPSFWPSLGVRTCIAIMIAGVFGFMSAAFSRTSDIRLLMTRFSGRWAFGALIASIPFAWWYVAVLPDPAQSLVLGKSPTIIAAIKWGAAATGIFLSVSLLAGIVRPQWNRKSTAMVAMASALVIMGSFEWIREAARRPYAINEVIYSNMIMKEDLTALQQRGFITEAVWVEDREINDGNRLEVGEELFIHQCYACHTVGGVNNDLRQLTERMSHAALTSYIKKIHEVRYFMPPFAGTEAEVDALAAYIAGDWHKKDVRPATAADTPVGAQVFDNHCSACHERPSVVGAVEGMNTAEVVDLLGRLNELSEEMEPFTGSPDEATALAAYLNGSNGGGTAGEMSKADGAQIFADNCAVCHNPDELAAAVAGWERTVLRDGMDRLNELSAEMPPFEGTVAEKDAVTDYLIDQRRSQ